MITSLLRRIFPGLRTRFREWQRDRRLRRITMLSLKSGRRGTRRKRRSPEIVITLTSWEPRLPGLHICLESLLRQKLKPDRIILWLADGTESTDEVKRMESRGLEILHCEDTRSFKKIIPALKILPDAILVTADDDVVYSRNWLSDLVRSFRTWPDAVHCHIAHRMVLDSSNRPLPYSEWDFFSPGITGPSFLLFPTGVGGVLYPPGIFHEDVTREDLFMSLTEDADDVWLKAMTLLNGIPVVKVRKAFSWPLYVPGSQSVCLTEKNLWGSMNDVRLEAVFDHYGLAERIGDLTDPE